MWFVVLKWLRQTLSSSNRDALRAYRTHTHLPRMWRLSITVSATIVLIWMWLLMCRLLLRWTESFTFDARIIIGDCVIVIDRIQYIAIAAAVVFQIVHCVGFRLCGSRRTLKFIVEQTDVGGGRCCSRTTTSTTAASTAGTVQCRIDITKLFTIG